MSIRIFRRGNTWWVDVRVNGERVRESARTKNEATAKAYAETVEWRISNSPAGGAWTLAEAVKRTTAIRWAGSRGETTATYNAAEAVTYFSAEARLESITTDAIDGYVEWLEQKGNSGATVNRKLAALSAVLRTALQRGQLRTMPAIPRRRESAGRMRWLTTDEETRLLQFMEPEDARLVLFLVDTGARLGEALRLEWRDVDLQAEHPAAHLWVTKTDHPRTVPLTARVVRVLGDAGDGRVFPVSRQSFRHRWDRARGMMELHDDPEFVPHALRHTCASRLIQRGVPLAVVKAWMGHKAIQTTMRYAHLAPANLHAARLALEPVAVTPLRAVS